MPEFLEIYPTLPNQWRAVVLFGLNSASYKFALGKALLSLRGTPGDLITLDNLALPFAREVCGHLGKAPRQATNSKSRFLDACRQANSGEITEAQLQATTVKLGFANVIDAFHNLAGGALPSRFFVDERQANKGIRLTDEFRKLTDEGSPTDLELETEGRWRLVETAWSLGLNPELVQFDTVTEELFVSPSGRRVPVTSSRAALNGYQKGHCFFCFAPVSIDPTEPDLADVDHFFPHALRSHLQRNINGVWNLVLACATCNRGARGKFDLVPSLGLLERLHTRNEFLITSHHPLRETLISQTGATPPDRASYLQGVYRDARLLRIGAWEPEARGPALF